MKTVITAHRSSARVMLTAAFPLIRMGLCLITLLCTVGCARGEKDITTVGEFSHEDASVLMGQYTRALASGDTAAIRPFWNEQSVAREGFWYLHAWIGMRLEVEDWPEFLADNHFEVGEVRPGPHYYTIHGVWIENDSAPGQRPSRNMIYYVVREEERWVLTNPIEILTRDWLAHETRYFRYRYPPDIDIADYSAELQVMDRECGRVLQLLQLDLREKIEFFRTHTPEECGDLLLHPPAHGYVTRGYPYPGGIPRGYRVIVSTSFLHLHELIHLLHVEAGIPSTTVAFSEGLATALGGGAAFTADFVPVECCNLMSEPNGLSLRELLTLPDAEFFRRNYETYVLAGGIFRFLLDRFGIESLTQLAHVTRDATEYERTIPQVYGFDVDALDSMWRRHLSDLDIPAVGFSISPAAGTVFAMADPEHDDVGDGDYAPPGRYEDGVFDLTYFEVLSDSTNVYFRLQYRHVAPPVAYRAGGERFAPTAVIAIDMGETEPGHTANTTDGVRFAEGRAYGVKVIAGTQVSLCDNFGFVYFTTPDVWDRMVNRQTSTVELSLPVDLFGEPDAEWRYFVGIGLASNRTMNFLHGGPAPAYREHPVFLSGGNYDYGNPAFIDILLNVNIDQTAILGAYDGPSGRLAVVPMVGGSAPR